MDRSCRVWGGLGVFWVFKSALGFFFFLGFSGFEGKKIKGLRGRGDVSESSCTGTV